MQNQIIDYGCTTARPFITRLVSALTAMVGGLMLCALTCHIISTAAAEWSPTETARECFRFPDEATLPDREGAAQLLLSAAFFGSDALYFDEGEENTGMTEPYPVNPSNSHGEESPEAPIGEPSTPIPSDTDIYSYDRSLVPAGQLAILPYDLTSRADVGEVLLSNTTAYSIDINALLQAPYPIVTRPEEYSTDKPLVLIIHTHGTEAYSENGALYCSPSAVQRSSHTDENMIAVGAVMADLLNDAGIPTIHCEIMHDLESYTRSYNLAADTIQKYLAEYPSIKYVFDVHRDAIVHTNGDLIRPVTMINGEVAAQVMLLVGTNEKGADHPDWETNMTVAAHLQTRLSATYTRFARPINIRGASFNEQLTPGSLLIEIGSAANSLKEAKTAAKYLTYSIIDMIKDNAKE